MKIVIEFDHTEMHEAEIAARAGAVISGINDFENYMRTKIKHGNHGEEAHKALMDVSNAFFDCFEEVLK